MAKDDQTTDAVTYPDQVTVTAWFMCFDAQMQAYEWQAGTVVNDADQIKMLVDRNAPIQ